MYSEGLFVNALRLQERSRILGTDLFSNIEIRYLGFVA